jgi:hypothetical protein
MVWRSHSDFLRIDESYFHYYSLGERHGSASLLLSINFLGANGRRGSRWLALILVLKYFAFGYDSAWANEEIEREPHFHEIVGAFVFRQK